MKRNPQPHFIQISTKRIKTYLMTLLFSFICAIAFWIGGQPVGIQSIDSTVSIGFYANQANDDLSHVFTTAIDDAKKSVLLLIYSLTDRKVINCLKNQSRKGVDVKVVCDAKASPYADSKLGDLVDTTRRYGPGLMHQKILVVDEEKVWLGSANMTTESLRMHGNLVIALNSKNLAQKIHQKAENLGIEGKGAPFLNENFMIGGQEIELWFLPDDQKALLRIKNLIGSAKKTIRIAMFTWTRHDLAQAVIDAQKRGVETQVVIDHYSGKGASSAVVKMLKDNGVHTSLSLEGPLLHHKFLYIDNQILVNGSANWTKRAFTQNDDCFIVIHNLTTQQNQQMDHLWKIILKESVKQ